MIDCQVLASSSKGNAVVINKTILIDCGVSFRALKDVYSDLQLVLLTHIHGDHFNKRTIKRLALERPTLRFGCCEWLAGNLLDVVEPRNIDIYEVDNTKMYNNGVTVKPAALVHNVPNCAYLIRIAEKGSVFYATDMNNLDNIDEKDCDLYLLESNYGDEEIVERIRQKQKSGEHIYEWDALDNHMSREKAIEWLYKNMGMHSRYIFLHQHEGAFDD